MTIENHGNYEICAICNWEDDPVQAKNPQLEGSANQESLIQVQEKIFKQIPLNITQHIGDDKITYARDPNWKPFSIVAATPKNTLSLEEYIEDTNFNY